MNQKALRVTAGILAREGGEDVNENEVYRSGTMRSHMVIETDLGSMYLDASTKVTVER